jgi:hypothetical protein
MHCLELGISTLALYICTTQSTVTYYEYSILNPACSDPDFRIVRDYVKLDVV